MKNALVIFAAVIALTLPTLSQTAEEPTAPDQRSEAGTSAVGACPSSQALVIDADIFAQAEAKACTNFQCLQPCRQDCQFIGCISICIDLQACECDCLCP